LLYLFHRIEQRAPVPHNSRTSSRAWNLGNPLDWPMRRCGPRVRAVIGACPA